MEKNQMVVYKDIARMLDGSCGLVTGVDAENPDWVWIHWLGNDEISKELIEELKVI